MVIIFPNANYLKLMSRDVNVSYEKLGSIGYSFVHSVRYFTDYHDHFIRCLDVLESKAIALDLPRPTTLDFRHLDRFTKSVYGSSMPVHLRDQEKMHSALLKFPRTIPLEYCLSLRYVNETNILDHFTSSFSSLFFTFNFYQDLISFDENTGQCLIETLLQNYQQVIPDVHCRLVSAIFDWELHRNDYFKEKDYHKILTYLAYTSQKYKSNFDKHKRDIVSFLSQQPYEMKNFSVLKHLVKLYKQKKVSIILLKDCFKGLLFILVEKLKTRHDDSAGKFYSKYYIDKNVKSKVSYKMKLKFLQEEKKVVFDPSLLMPRSSSSIGLNAEIDKLFESLGYAKGKRLTSKSHEYRVVFGK